MHHRTRHRQVFVGFSGCVWLARNSERSCGDRTSDAQTDTVRTSNSKVMSSLLLVRKCFLASSPLGRHSLELRASVSRVFSPIARDWLKIRFCIGAASLRPCSVLLEYLSYAHWLLRLSTSISRQTNNHICSASYRKISAELCPDLRSRRERNKS